MRGPEVCRELDISYRQLDYLRRLDLLPLTGSGHPLEFSEEDVMRLAVAVALSRAGGERSWPRMAAACLAGPTPPPSGWVSLSVDGVLTYGTLDEVVEALAGAAIMAEFGTPAGVVTAA